MKRSRAKLTRQQIELAKPDSLFVTADDTDDWVHASDYAKLKAELDDANTQCQKWYLESVKRAKEHNEMVNQLHVMTNKFNRLEAELEQALVDWGTVRLELAQTKAENAVIEALERVKSSAGTPEQVWEIAREALTKHRGEK